MALTLTDQTVNGNDLTNSGAGESATAPFVAVTKSADLERGESDYLYATDSASLSFTGDHCFEVCLKFESLPSAAGGSMFILDSEITTARYFCFFDSADKLQVGFINASGTSRFVSTNAVVTGTDYFHLACSADVSGPTISCYKDGAAIAGSMTQTAATSIRESVSNWYFGCENTGTPGAFFDGLMAEPRIWNTVRSEAQIQANYQKKLVGNESGLVLYVPFDGTVATVLTGGNSIFFSSGGLGLS